MIAITGVSGLVGANLARALLTRGQQVRGVVHRERRAVEGLDIRLFEADVRDQESLHRAFKGVDVVYHCAARISLELDSWSEVQAVNVMGTRNVVDACRACGVRRLVHFSSIHAFEQAPLDVPLDENRPRVSSDSASPYDLSKVLGEAEALRGIQQGMEVVILNPTAIVGPYDVYPSYFGQALLSLYRGRVPALVSGGFDWVDVRDVAYAAIEAGETAESGASYILSGHWRSVRQVADQVTELGGRRVPPLTAPLGLAYWALPLVTRLRRVNNTLPIYTRLTLDALRSNRLISHARASRDLGYHPRPFRETIRDTLDWFADNSYMDSHA